MLLFSYILQQNIYWQCSCQKSQWKDKNVDKNVLWAPQFQVEAGTDSVHAEVKPERKRDTGRELERKIRKRRQSVRRMLGDNMYNRKLSPAVPLWLYSQT